MKINVSLSYGPDRQRWYSRSARKWRTDTLTVETLYDGDYERVTMEDGTVREFHYLGRGLVCVKTDGGSPLVLCALTDNVGSYVQMADTLGVTRYRANYDAWGRQTVTVNAVDFRRGYGGHETMTGFALVNMDGRLYDPDLGRFLSPDNYVQAPDDSQSFNRFSYCLNNPLKYTDPTGEVWWVPIAIGAAIFSVGNTIAHAKNHDLHKVGDYFKYFFQGAVVGAVVGAAWTCSGAVPYIGGELKGILGVSYGIQGTANSFGMTSSLINWICGNKKAADNAFKLFLGNYYLDETDFFGGMWKGILRHTWEAPQTSIGYLSSQVINGIGYTDRVDYLKGVTFSTSYTDGKGKKGFSLSNFINIFNNERIDEPFLDYVLKNPTYMHEFGHTYESHMWGPLYIPVIAIPSVLSISLDKKNHKYKFFERWASMYGFQAFKKYGIDEEEYKKQEPF